MVSVQPNRRAVSSRPVGPYPHIPEIAEIALRDGHVLAERTVLATRTRRGDRALCGRKLEELAHAPGDVTSCTRCRLTLTRTLGYLLRTHGPDAVVTVDGERWSARVARTMWPGLLARARVHAEVPGGRRGHTWATLEIAGSSLTHIGMAAAVVHDPVFDRWVSATDPAPRTTGCLRLGSPSATAGVEPSTMCTACAAARDRMTEKLVGLLGPTEPLGEGAPAGTTAPLRLRDGDPVPPIGAGDRPRTVVARVRLVEGIHARLVEALRPDAVLDAVNPVAKVGIVRSGTPALCNDQRTGGVRQVTPTGACARCAVAVGRLAKTLVAQWPQVSPMIDVDGRPLPVEVLGGGRLMLGDPVLLAAAEGPSPMSADRPSDRLVLGAPLASDGVRHLGWAQRSEQDNDGAVWTARIPAPRHPICHGQEPDDLSVAPGEICLSCLELVADPRMRRGRFAPDPAAKLAVGGTVYDPSMGELFGREFLIEMIRADLSGDHP